MKILATGFEPFGNWAVNPTQVAIKSLNGNSIVLQDQKIEIVGKIIKLRFNTILHEIATHINSTNPIAILMTGQGRGEKLRLERTAKNYVQTKVPYNCGTIKTGEILRQDATSNIPSSLPLEKIYTALNSNQIPVSYSEDAGNFGCNQIFFQVRDRFPEISAGFIHVPLLPNQTKTKNNMDQETITKGIKIALKTIAQSHFNN